MHARNSYYNSKIFQSYVRTSKDARNVSHKALVKAFIHYGRFARAGFAAFQNLLTRT